MICEIKEFEDYLINTNGEIISKRLKKPLKKRKIKNGYYQVCLCNNKKRKYLLIHRLVAQTFIPNPLNMPQVNHIDENKNNNNVSNLEWCTAQYNTDYSKSTKITAINKKSGLILQEKSLNEICREYNFDLSNVWRCYKGKQKTHKGFVFI